MLWAQRKQNPLETEELRKNFAEKNLGSTTIQVRGGTDQERAHQRPRAREKKTLMKGNLGKAASRIEGRKIFPASSIK